MKDLSRALLICFIFWQVAQFGHARLQEWQALECGKGVEADYSTNWDNECKNLNKKANCSLPKYIAEDLNKTRKEDIRECAKIYLGK